MAEEKYSRLSFYTKSGWEYFYLKSNGEIKMTNLSSNKLKNSKLEEITKEENTKIINDSQYDFSYG